ncbi:NAD(P)/FAD-dependent oxidoreductase [Gemmatimonadota bacterium]
MRVAGDPPEDVLHFDVSNRDLRGYAWDFPTPLEGRVLVSRGIYALQIPGAPPADVQEHLRRRLEGLGLLLEEHRVKRMAERGFEPHQPFSRRRVILVGEAAGVDPLTGEGIAEAIQYGALAGPYLARKLEVGDFEFTDWRTHFLKSSLGADLFLRRWAALLCFRYARRSAESVFAGVPGALTLATGLFAGRYPY